MKFSKEDTQKVKGVAIIFMLIHHCFLSPDRYKGKVVDFQPFQEWIVNDVALAMKICVAMFVFLSAYGIALSLKRVNSEFMLSKKEISNAVIKRYVKLITGFIFVFLLLQIYSIITGQGWYTHVYGKEAIGVLYFFIDMFGLAQFFQTPTFISTFWYMSLAQIIIWVVPVMIWLYKKFGGMVALGLSATFSMLFPIKTANTAASKTYVFFPIYIVCIVVGIIAADKDLLVKMKKYNPIKRIPALGKLLKCIAYLIAIIIILYFRHKTRLTTLLPIWEGIVTLLVIAFIFEYINGIPGIKNILSLLGKHSMNIFLIHSFIRMAWYYDFIYSFRNAYLIVAVLLTTSLCASFIIEFIRKVIGFDKGVSWLMHKMRID